MKKADSVDQDTLNREWCEMAPAWIKESREGINPTRTGLLDAPMLSSCGNVEGLNILDCGCGEGRFCRMLVQRGAEFVLGIDLCPSMIEAADESRTDRDKYRVADARKLDFLETASFDICISYLNQCDLPDFQENCREVFRVLKPGGRFIIANLHPMRSAVGGWHRSDDGGKLHVILDEYFVETERHWKMLGSDFTNFHRTLSTYIRCFLRTGFILKDLIEPTLNKFQLKSFPQLSDEVRVPNFIIYVLSKPC